MASSGDSSTRLPPIKFLAVSMVISDRAMEASWDIWDS